MPCGQPYEKRCIPTQELLSLRLILQESVPAEFKDVN
jgi:hypothetical protein